MSVSLMEKPIVLKSTKIWNVPSQRSKFLVLGNQHDNLKYNVVVLIKIIPKKGNPLVFRAKIQKKSQGLNPNSFLKIIRIPQNQLPFMPENIKMVDVEITKSK